MNEQINLNDRAWEITRELYELEKQHDPCEDDPLLIKLAHCIEGHLHRVTGEWEKEYNRTLQDRSTLLRVLKDVHKEMEITRPVGDTAPKFFQLKRRVEEVLGGESESSMKLFYEEES